MKVMKSLDTPKRPRVREELKQPGGSPAPAPLCPSHANAISDGKRAPGAELGSLALGMDRTAHWPPGPTVGPLITVWIGRQKSYVSLLFRNPQCSCLG